MRLAIVGSRDFTRLDLVRAYVAALPSDTTVVSGHARGVDREAEEAARACGLTVESYPADWARHGNSAGVERNKAMLSTVDRAVVFWDGRSPGSRHAIEFCRMREIDTLVRIDPCPYVEAIEFCRRIGARVEVLTV